MDTQPLNNRDLYREFEQPRPQGFLREKPWGLFLFLESPGNFTGPKSNIQIEI